jgi:hypothetical protein
MLQMIRSKDAFDGPAAPARASQPNEIEARFLQSLREGASDLEESGNAESWRELEQQCRSALRMDEEKLRFLLGNFDSQKTRRALAKVTKTWNSKKSQLARPRRFSLRPRIAMLLSEGQSIRTFLLTDTSKRIAAWADLFVLSPHNVKAEVEALGPHAQYLPIPMLRRTRFDYLVGYLGFLQTEGQTTRRFAERLDESFQLARQSGEPMSGSLRIWEIGTAYRSSSDYLELYNWNLKLFAHTHCLKESMALLDMLDPDVLFNTSLVSWPSRLWTRAAALNGLPIITNIISWDNMSTKTLLDEFVDTFLVWSEEMDGDFATSLPFVREKRRLIVGSPQFEPIVQGRGLVPKAEFLGRYGLDPAKKLILYTTGSKTLFPREADCLDRLLGHWRDNLKDRANIMVRMHPKDRQGRYEEVMAKFPEVPFTLAGETVEGDNQWVPKPQDIDLLVNQLRHCDVIINVASTMTLEGFAIDKPSINIGFSLGLSVSARYPMDDYYKSRHYCDVVGSGAAVLVNDYDEMFSAIDGILEHKQFGIDTQRRILAKKCKYTEDASWRIDRFLKSYAFAVMSPMARGLRSLRRLRRSLRRLWERAGRRFGLQVG